ncbi:hypothetical protein BKA80DRAFT_18195 [Phyllosticta citrichinensis]
MFEEDRASGQGILRTHHLHHHQEPSQSRRTLKEGSSTGDSGMPLLVRLVGYLFKFHGHGTFDIFQGAEDANSSAGPSLTFPLWRHSRCHPTRSCPRCETGRRWFWSWSRDLVDSVARGAYRRFQACALGKRCKRRNWQKVPAGGREEPLLCALIIL